MWRVPWGLPRKCSGSVAATPVVLARHVVDVPEDQRDHLESVWDGVDGRNGADPWVIGQDMMSPYHSGVTSECRGVFLMLSTPLQWGGE